MEELIVKQTKDKEAQEVTELVLDNVRCNITLGSLLDKFSNLRRLSVVNAGLLSLEGFPSLPNLDELQLGDNKLSGGLEVLTQACPQLNCLGLAGNRISELEDLKPLRSLSMLVSLDLYNCPITDLKEYRSQVFQLLPSLKSLDGLNEKGEDLESEEEEEEEEEEGDDEDEPGLDYLLNNDIRSSDSDEEGDYDPDLDQPASGDDDEGTEDDDEDATGEGPSSSKRPRLDNPAQGEPESSDTD